MFSTFIDESAIKPMVTYEKKKICKKNIHKIFGSEPRFKLAPQQEVYHSIIQN